MNPPAHLHREGHAFSFSARLPAWLHTQEPGGHGFTSIPTFPAPNQANLISRSPMRRRACQCIFRGADGMSTPTPFGTAASTAASSRMVAPLSGTARMYTFFNLLFPSTCAFMALWSVHGAAWVTSPLHGKLLFGRSRRPPSLRPRLGGFSPAWETSSRSRRPPSPIG